MEPNVELVSLVQPTIFIPVLEYLFYKSHILVFTKGMGIEKQVTITDVAVVAAVASMVVVP